MRGSCGAEGSAVTTAVVARRPALRGAFEVGSALSGAPARRARRTGAAASGAAASDEAGAAASGVTGAATSGVGGAVRRLRREGSEGLGCVDEPWASRLDESSSGREVERVKMWELPGRTSDFISG